MKSKRCKILAEVGYHESRSESDEGMAAVMHVVLNRVAHPVKWGTSVKNVVYQKHQFSYLWDGSKEKGFLEKKQLKRSAIIARKVLDGEIPDPTKGATFYHTQKVVPSWSKSFTRVAVIGSHIFYV